MTDVFAFSHRGGTASAGSRVEQGCAVFAVADSGDDSAAVRWLNACEVREGTAPDALLRALTEQTNGQNAVAALALGGGRVAWSAFGGAKVCRFRGAVLQPDADSGTAAVQEGDAFFLCSNAARRLLLAEEIMVDRLKAESARQWAELLLLRVMERLANPPEGLSLLTVRVTA